MREEFNRAEKLQNDGRAGTVGFALTILQRRLASSSAALFFSLQRRRERLESRQRDLEEARRASGVMAASVFGGPVLSSDEIEDLEDAPDDEVERTEEETLDQATAARTLVELQTEIKTLKRLESMAGAVYRSGQDTKWRELSHLLQDLLMPLAPSVVDVPDADGDIAPPIGSRREKLVIFTEHRDTQKYLQRQINALMGGQKGVEVIHGGMGRDERRVAQDRFLNDPSVQVLLATDAAGEGINLQRAHFMVNYDLPWNPNRLEQRFGRIHRIGQTEVCYLWNLLAAQTREGDVYHKLLEKLERARHALGGQVFDVLGQLQFDGKSLRDLLIEAIRYGEQPEVRDRLNKVIEDAVDSEHLEKLLDEQALARDVMSLDRVAQVREEMERAEARRLQPHYIESFFLEAFRLLGGAARLREPRRYEITYVPQVLRDTLRVPGASGRVLQRYERIAFEKDLLNVSGKPLAAFICPGHPLLDAVLGQTLENYRDLLRRGAVMVDERDPGLQPRALFYLENTIQDGNQTTKGDRRAISQRILFVEMDGQGRVRPLNYAPYLDYRPLKEGEPSPAEILTRPECAWVSEKVEQDAWIYAINNMVPQHLKEVRDRRMALIHKTRSAVHERLTKEISHWDLRAQELAFQERAGKQAARLNSVEAARRADEMRERLKKRMLELDAESQVLALPPQVLGGVLVVPAGLVAAMMSGPLPVSASSTDTQAAAARAREIVMEIERGLGFDPADREFERLGYDIESRIPATGQLRFIEVKGRMSGAGVITATKNEILYSLNKPDDYILALVEFLPDGGHRARYVRRPFTREPDFNVTSVNYDFERLLGMSEAPS